MAGYWIVRGSEIKDEEALKKYAELWVDIAACYGAELVAGRGAVDTREGPHYPRQLIVRFDSYQQAVDCLYTAESADHYAVELSKIWMTDTFLTTTANTAYQIIPPNDIDGDGVDDANLDIDGDGNNDFQIEVRCIEGSGTGIGALSNEANNLPTQQHITIPPIGSGYSLKYFEVRKYGITGTASNGCSIVQLGTYKVFNKFRK